MKLLRDCGLIKGNGSSTFSKGLKGNEAGGGISHRSESNGRSTNENINSDNSTARNNTQNIKMISSIEADLIFAKITGTGNSNK